MTRLTIPRAADTYLKRVSNDEVIMAFRHAVPAYLLGAPRDGYRSANLAAMITSTGFNCAPPPARIIHNHNEYLITRTLYSYHAAIATTLRNPRTHEEIDLIRDATEFSVTTSRHIRRARHLSWVTAYAALDDGPEKLCAAAYAVATDLLAKTLRATKHEHWRWAAYATTMAELRSTAKFFDLPEWVERPAPHEAGLTAKQTAKLVKLRLTGQIHV